MKSDDSTAIAVLKRFGPLGMVVLLHAAFFYALQSGLLREAVRLLPREIVVGFVTPEPQQQEQPSPQQKSNPKPVSMVKRMSPVKPPVPMAQVPSADAIEAPPSSSRSAETVGSTVAPVLATPVQPKTINSGIEYLQKPQPVYPTFSKRRGEQGKVMLRVLVNETGRPQHVSVERSSGSGRLDEAAQQAVMRALFKPYIEDGKAVAVYVLIPIDFQLDS